ncbi:MAG: lysophospholipid acyltransferase family protein [bacterium]|nr:lysophospholipid acyltransferase family protein [bacterium]
MIWSLFHLAGFFFRWMVRAKFIGTEHIPPGGGAIFLSNHISALDAVLVPWTIYSVYPEDTIWKLAKEELFRIPLAGWYLRNIHAFPIKRGAAELSAIRDLEGRIRRDKVILYPEGTRSRDGRLRRGNRMVGKIIRDTKPIVIPVYVSGTDQVFPVGRIFPRWGKEITIRFGASLSLDKEYAIENVRESSQAVVDRVMAAIAELGENGVEAPPAAPKEANR